MSSFQNATFNTANNVNALNSIKYIIPNTINGEIK